MYFEHASLSMWASTNQFACMLQVMRDYHNFVGANCPYIFMDREGRGFTHITLSTKWTVWLWKKAGVKMPPSQCRQVFVGERRSDDAVEGPSDVGAAHIMGHSVSQWDKWYDTQFHLRQGQNAVNAMDKWRRNLLAQDEGANHTEPAAAAQQEEDASVLTDLPEEDSFVSCVSGADEAEQIDNDVVIELD